MQQSARTPRHIGAIVRRARRQAGLTQAALAERIRVRQATISRLEQGQGDTRLSTLLDVLAALGLQIVVDARGKTSVEDIARLF